MAQTTAESGAAAHGTGEHDHPDIGIFLKVWGLLFVLSVLSYIVDVAPFPEHLQWVQVGLITIFAFLKAGFIMHIFMHLKWERPTLVYMVLLPLLLLVLLVLILVWEGAYVHGVRQFFLGG